MHVFGLPHIAMLAATVVVAAAFVALGRRTPDGAARRWIELPLAAVLLVNEIIWQAYQIRVGDWTVASSLPLHLCDATVLVCLVVLVTRSQLGCELLYFWGLGGSVQALLTPSLGAGFPSYEFFRYFISHSGIVVVAAYFTFGRRMRPRRDSVARVILITAIYTVVVGVADWALGANYMFLCDKPPDTSLIDALGPWPWYLLPLATIAAAMMALLYLPYFIADRRKRERATPC